MKVRKPPARAIALMLLGTLWAGAPGEGALEVIEAGTVETTGVETTGVETTAGDAVTLPNESLANAAALGSAGSRGE